MAKQTTVALVDDIDGSKGTETIQFGIDGQQFEIDLNTKNAKALRKALADFTSAARTVKPSSIASNRGTASIRARKNSAKTSAPAARATKDDTAAIRAWAAANGFAVAARGRISADIKAQYAASTGTNG